MAVAFTLHAVYFWWDIHMGIAVLAVETGQTRCLQQLRWELMVLFKLQKVDIWFRMVPHSHFLFATSKYSPLPNTSEPCSPCGRTALSKASARACSAQLHKNQQQQTPPWRAERAAREQGAGQGTEGSSAHSVTHPCSGDRPQAGMAP